MRGDFILTYTKNDKSAKAHSIAPCFGGGQFLVVILS